MADLDRLSSCAHAVCKHQAGDLNPRKTLAALAEATGAEEAADVYGGGRLIEDFESRMATLLGHGAAAFFPSGIMAQQCAVRIWADRSGRKTLAFHPRSHLEEDEQGAYAAVHGLRAVHVGRRDRVATAADLGAVVDPIAALVVELPQRRIGGQLPQWDDLEAQRAWCREHGAAFHLDGARIWEAQPHYAETHGKGLADVGGLFDSVYASFYKGLGGLAGAVLAGSPDFVAQAKIWRRRHGGTLIHLFPYVLSARQALDARLGRMAEYRAVARALASALGELDGVELVPEVPPANMFQVLLRCSRDALERAVLDMAEEHDVRMLSVIYSAEAPHRQMFEITVGDATLELGVERIVALFRELLGRL